MKKFCTFLALVMLCSPIFASTSKEAGDKGYLGNDQWAVRTDGEIEALGAYTITTSGAIATATFSASGDLDVNGDIVGDGGGEISGMLADNEIVTDDTLVAAETGRVNIVTTASTKTLPLMVAGMHYKFVSGDAVAITVDPNVADTIKVDTHVLDAGDKAVTVAATGNTIELFGSSTANTWYSVCYPDACADGGA